MRGARTESRSLLRYSPALLLVAIAVADAGRFADPDLWGHVRFGQGVLNTWHLPIMIPTHIPPRAMYGTITNG